MERVMRIDRKSSIETEPRTLPVDQIDNAREAAMDVMNTRSVEEAVSIFTQGLEPVVSVAKAASRTIDLEEDWHHHHHHAAAASARLREILSAPF